MIRGATHDESAISLVCRTRGRNGLEIYEPLQLKDRAATARAIAGEHDLGRAIADLQDLGRELPVAAAFRIPVQSAAVYSRSPIKSSAAWCSTCAVTSIGSFAG